MKITWQVEDGYVRPAQFTTVIDDEDLEGYEGDEREDFIMECIQDDFEQKVSWSIVSRD